MAMPLPGLRQHVSNLLYQSTLVVLASLARLGSRSKTYGESLPWADIAFFVEAVDWLQLDLYSLLFPPAFPRRQGHLECFLAQ